MMGVSGLRLHSLGSQSVRRLPSVSLRWKSKQSTITSAACTTASKVAGSWLGSEHVS
jgi:hypothetical protein